MVKTVLAAVLPLAAVWVSTDSKTPQSDLDAIKQTALDYGLGWYEGNGERMGRAVHPDLAKRALMPDARSGKGKIDHMSAMRLVQATRKGFGAKTPTDVRRTDVTILDVFGNAACVKLQMHGWVDYMHMSKMGGKWVIVNVLWEFTPETKKEYGIPEEL